jgi:hypothetical protein
MNSTTFSVERDTSQMRTRLGFSFFFFSRISKGTPP